LVLALDHFDCGQSNALSQAAIELNVSKPSVNAKDRSGFADM
jgi:hypothetical protein